MKKIQDVGWQYYFRFFIILTLGGIISACGKAPEDEPVGAGDFTTGVIFTNNLVERSDWSSSRQRLTVSGVAFSGDTQVQVFDGTYPTVLIGTAFVDDDRDWRFRKIIRDNTEVPCSVVVKSESATQSVRVSNAPSGCSTAYENQASGTVDNNPPQSIIATPSSAVSIFAGDTVNFQGSAVDPDGDTNLTYLWNFSGVAPNSASLNPGNIQFNSPGSFVISFTATDSFGLSDPSPAQVVVTVNAITNNSAPNGTILSPASNQTISVGGSVFFSGIGVDPEGDSISYLWNFGASGISSSTQSTPGSLRFNTAGTYVIALTVTDAAGASDTSPASVTVTVIGDNNTNTGNNPPNGVIATPQANTYYQAGTTVNFTGSATDPDGDNNLIYIWDFGGYAPRQIGQTASIVVEEIGLVNVRLLVRDSTRLWDATPATTYFHVTEGNNNNNNNSNQAPESTIVSPANDITITEGDSVNFAGIGVDPDGDTNLSYLWNFDGAAANSTSVIPGTVRFNNPGVYRVRFTATDSLGLSDATPDEVVVNVQAININNQAPESVITAPAANITIQRGQSAIFNGSGTDADGNTPLNYFWDFGGGATNSTRQNPGTVTFNQAGFFTVSFTVTDSRGLSDASPATRFVRVVDNTANQAPNATILSPATNMNISAGDSVLFSGTATDPENNSPLSYLWNYDGAMPNTTAQNPGVVRFDTPGIYLVELSATDSLGARDATPDMRVITVTGNNTNNLTPPESEIVQPVSNMTISVGDSVNFQGRVTGSNNSPFTYLWNLDGAAPNSTQASPGTVTFHNAGIYEITFRATDRNGLSDPTPDTVQIIVQNTLAVNEPPNGTIMSPGPFTTIYTGDSLNFTAIGFDPDGDSLNYLWNFDGATSDKFVKDPGIIQFNTPGIYDVMMAVSDSAGLTDPTPAMVKVVVQSIASSGSPPNALIAQPSSNLTIFEGDSVSFTGFVVDSDNNVASYLWNFDGAAGNSTEQNPGTVTFSHAGTYRVRFTATDTTGLSDPTPDEVIVTVEQFNMPSGILAPNGIINSPSTDMVIQVGEAVDFAATAIDPDNDSPFSYRWNFDGAVPNTTAQNPGWVTFNQVGTYRVVLTVTDSAGVSDPTPAERIITVQSVQSSNNPPNGSIASPNTDRFINVGDSLYFAGGGTDPEFNFPLTYYWDFNGAVPNFIGAVPGNVMFNQEGVYDVQLKVIDSFGLVDPTPDTVRVTVGNTSQGNQPPESFIDSPVTAMTVFAGDTVAFRGRGVDPEGGQVSYHWEFGSNSIAHQYIANPTVTFNTPGTYVVKLVTTDAQGMADPTAATVTITVDQGNVVLVNEPNGTIVSPAAGPVFVSAGDSVTFSAQTTDPNGDPNLFVVWNFGTYPIQNQVGNTITVEFDEPGSTTVTLRVRDSTNLWDPTPDTIDVIVQ